MEKYLPILRSCPFFMGLKDTEILSILHCVNAVKAVSYTHLTLPTTSRV